jgi:chromosome segregation ATPase
MHKKFLNSTEIVSDQKNQMSITEQQTRNLENEIKQHSHVEQKLSNTISKVTKEKEQMTEELQNLSDRFDAVNEELNAKIYQINDYKEKLLENQTRLVKSHSLLQTAQNDIINLEKDLQAGKESQEELREKLKV